VHVHVDRLERQVDEQDRAREAAARQHVAVAVDERVLEDAVAHRPPVHEQVHAGEAAAVAVGARDPSVRANAALGRVDRDQRRGLALA
jgi:hypothetical protein